jgi:dimethylhistidine N-methyltransferase
MRHSVASETAPADRKQFAEDVSYYLSLSPRQLPSRYLYDGLGSALFEAISRLPWYRITRTETRLLAARAGQILARVRPLSTLVELGPGGGEKPAALLAGHEGRAVTVHLIDVSAAALDAATRSLGADARLVVVPHQATYEEGLAEIAHGRPGAGRTLALFLGSNIGNFDPPGADALLQNIRAALATGDSLLLGTDLVRSESDLLVAYDDPLGVTAAFNRNLLVRANRELGANFNVRRFAHRAVWNGGESRVEMHLVSTRRQHVSIPASSLEITFVEGETVWTESSYKYRPHEVIEMLDRAGFATRDQWTDDGFALTLAEAGRPRQDAGRG